MITKTIKTTGGPLKITIPSDRSEISLDLLIRLTPERSKGETYSPIQQLSILSGIPVGDKEFDKRELGEDENCLYYCTDPEAFNVFDETLQKIAYQLAAFVEVQEIPKHITLQVTESHTKRWFNRRGVNNLKTVPVISNLGIAPAGAYMEAKEVIMRDMKEWQQHNPEVKDMEGYAPKLESYLHILALYFYVPATGEKFNSTRAAEFQEVIKKCMITDVLPIARHFFLKYPNLSKPKVKPSLAALKQLRQKQA